MKNKTKLCLLVVFSLLLTGCGSNDYIKDEDNKIVINEVTGQNLQKDIFCKPSEDTEVYKLYEKYEDQMKYELKDLPKCSEFKINSTKTKSLWQGVFVKPLAYIILKLGYVLKDWGLTKSFLAVSLIIIGLLIRIIILPFNIKTQNQSRNMQKAMPELQRIEKKYANRQDQEAMALKAQETMLVYQKYKVNPFVSCLIALIQIPLFFAFLQAIYKIPAIYEGEIFGWNLGTTPSVGIFQDHNYTFIILLVLIVLTTYFSFKYTMSQSQASATTPNAGNQMKYMLYFMTVLIGITSFSLPTAIAVYWVVTYAFIIIQTFVMNLIRKNKENNSNKRVEKETKKIKDKIKEKEGMKYGKNK